MNETEEESFTAIPEPVLEQISPGVHTLRIIRAENGVTHGKRMMDLTLELAPEFWPVHTRVWKTQNSVSVMQSVLRSAGHAIQPGQRFTFSPAQLVSRLCRVRIGKNERGYLDVLRWLPPKQTATSNAQEPDTADSEWDAVDCAPPRQNPPHASAKTQPSATVPQATEDPDDIPF